MLTVVTLLINKGAGLMAANGTGATPLHKAANGGHVRAAVRVALCCVGSLTHTGG